MQAQVARGAAVISGYNINDVHRHLNAVNPENLDSGTFTLDEAPTDGSTIKIRLVSEGTQWYSCTHLQLVDHRHRLSDDLTSSSRGRIRRTDSCRCRLELGLQRIQLDESTQDASDALNNGQMQP